MKDFRTFVSVVGCTAMGLIFVEEKKRETLRRRSDN